MRVLEDILLGVTLKYTLFFLISLFIYAEIVTMEDGSCYERKGNMNYIVPCVTKKTPETPESVPSVEKNEKCLFRIGEYEVQYLKFQSKSDNTVSCGDSRHYIDTMSLGYDKSLKTNKIKIGDLVVKKGLSKCVVELYHGDFMTIGLMSGDRLMCDNFMVYHSTANTADRSGRR